MTSFERFEGRLPAMLDELALPRLPDYADDLFSRTAATRQRPRWTFPERWLPMSVITARLAAAPRVPWRLGVLVALLAAAALIAAILAGSLLNRRPAPYGLAANGQVAFLDDTGRIVFGDLSTRTTRVVADTPDLSTPLISLDGTRVAFLRGVGKVGGSYDLMVVDSDGRNAMKLTTAAITTPAYLGWSGNGDRILVVDAEGRMLLFGTREAMPPINLSKDLELGQVSVGLRYNYRADAAFRPPSSDEILFTNQQETRLMAVRSDGSGIRTIVDGEAAGFRNGVRGAEWSPDGSKIVFLTGRVDGLVQTWHAYLVNADGSDLHPLSAFTSNPLNDQNSPLWSPDGTRIAFQYWTHHADASGVDFNPIGVVDVATGVEHDVGHVFTNDFISWEWSPDGKSILAVPGDGAGQLTTCGPMQCLSSTDSPVQIIIIDARTGTSSTTPWRVRYPINWQRVAP